MLHQPLFTAVVLICLIVLPLLLIRTALGIIGKKKQGKHCAKCGYSREGTADASSCPECGLSPYRGSNIHIRLHKRFRSRKRVITDLLLVVFAGLLAFGIDRADHYRNDLYFSFSRAILHGDVEKVEIYLAWFPELAKGTFRFDSSVQFPGEPLQSACRENDLQMIKLLLEHGADPNSAKEPPALDFMIKYQNMEGMQRLLDAGADPDVHANNPIVTALEVAINTDCPAEMIKMLLKYGANPNGSPQIYTALISATSRPDSAVIVELLLEAGADPNAAGDVSPPLFFAIGRHRVESVRLLLDAGAKINVINKYGRTPLDSALEINEGEPTEARQQIIDLLRSRGAKTKAELHEQTDNQP